jgi:hypothetical protein
VRGAFHGALKLRHAPPKGKPETFFARPAGLFLLEKSSCVLLNTFGLLWDQRGKFPGCARLF